MGTKGSTNRQRIIEAADRLFYMRGYNRTSFSDISDATGLPRGNFYYYFKTKEDILDAVVGARVKAWAQILKHCNETAADPRQRLLALVHMPGEHADVLQYGCPIGSLSSELGKSTEAGRQAITAVFDLLRHWCGEQLLALGLPAGRADQLALDLLARMQGMALIASVYRDNLYLKHAIEDIESWLDQTLNEEIA